MKIRCYPTREHASRDEIQGSTAVIIDVLRSSSSIIAAMGNGAEMIIPVDGVEAACNLVESSERGVKLLAGERSGFPLDGFDLGNSPFEFMEESIKGKTIILTTSNGTRAIVEASKAERILICAINNVGAVAEAVRDAGGLSIICCGDEGVLAAEDMLCGGILIGELSGIIDEESIDDTGRLALMLAERHGDRPEELLRSCDHGRKLVSLGFERDIVHCSTRDSACLVPEVRNGVIA